MIGNIKKKYVTFLRINATEPQKVCAFPEVYALSRDYFVQI